MGLNTILFVLLLVIVIRYARRRFNSYARILLPSIVLFAVGYYAGYSFSRLGAPEILKWVGGCLFVVEGLPHALKYIDDLKKRN